MQKLKKIEIDEMKEYLLGILQEFDKLCQENQMRYSIAYGTLLGAVRHKGFIPWDDDVDVVMPREDYEKLLSIKYKTKKYEVKSYRYSEDYYYEFSKMIDRETLVLEKYRCDANMGIFIDIFPMDYLEDKRDLEHAMRKAQKNKSMVLRLGSNLKSTTSNPILYAIKRSIRFLINPFRRKIIFHYENKSFGYPHKDNGLTVGLITSIYKQDFFPSLVWNDLIRIPFENIEVNAFREYDMYLSHLYGDYMTPPPIEERVTHHSFIAYKKYERTL